MTDDGKMGSEMRYDVRDTVRCGNIVRGICSEVKGPPIFDDSGVGCR